MIIRDRHRGHSFRFCECAISLKGHYLELTSLPSDKAHTDCKLPHALVPFNE